jgi:hypothetical protein
LDRLEARLRATKAIGVFTKISLKNQVDDRAYDLLIMKVLSLLARATTPCLARRQQVSRLSERRRAGAGREAEIVARDEIRRCGYGVRFTGGERRTIRSLMACRSERTSAMLVPVAASSVLRCVRTVSSRSSLKASRLSSLRSVMGR